RFTQKDLAATIQRIALDSLKGFYSGETADLIVETMEKYDGLISHDDLSNYSPVWRRPVNFKFDSLDIYSMPPPSSGGVLLGMILKLLQPIDFSTFSPKSPEYIHHFAEACRLVYAERAVHLGDPDFVDNPIEVMLSDDYLDARRELIDEDRAGLSREIESGIPQDYSESESTTHFSIADKSGNLVSLTYTLNTSYGSKLVVGGAGFLLNNEMDDFSIKPGVANVYGLVGGEANKIVSGKRMLSSMSPTIILKDDKPFLALGSPGGSKIITTVAQAIVNFSRFGLNLKQIVKMPRFHHQWLPDTLFFEQDGFDINIKQDLISKGHNIKERSQYSELMIISINENRMISGAADPRRNGS
ncbi:MAG: gamma-glutamyltransferase, partial [candidate division Zixibacteria bacterium]|nr:gamma-glutamyltransferase [candidate division Zixibacteria bacterium]